MENNVTTMGTKITLECDKDLKFYLEFFIGMELLKDKGGRCLSRAEFIRLFREWFKESNIENYTYYQIVVCLQAITKYFIELHQNAMLAPNQYNVLIKKHI